MYRPVFLVTVCAVGAAAAVHPAGLAFAGGQIPQLKSVDGLSTSSRRPTLRNALTQLRAKGDDSWVTTAKRSVTTSFFAASLALSGFVGVVPSVPVFAENGLLPEAKITHASSVLSGNFQLAEDGASALKMPDLKDIKIPKPGDDIVLPTGGKFKFGGDPNKKN
mmetsp:Transcript_38267/g.56198  ORF Transcript_38267/g.56198 Transcript_38267/m.56198 type:complete len:164 (+) Transcript_38267:31-522(+)